MSHAHLEALHASLDIPFDEGLSVRANKRQIIEGLGFSSGSSPTEFVNVPAGELANTDMQSVLNDTLQRGLYSSLLIEDGAWQHIGGCPVVYIMEEEELPNKIIFGDEGNIKQVEVTGGTHLLSPDAGLKVFSRKKSAVSLIDGFDNYTEPMRVALGGGFRLQIDDIVYEAGSPFLVLSAHFSFNDYGSRVLAKENEADAQVPMASKSFRVPIVDGAPDLPIHDIKRDELATADEAIDLVLAELFATDGKAICELTQHLLTIRPAMEIHQIEGIYGVTDEHGISAEVIDFDGLDTFDLVPTITTPVERLAGHQLRLSGYLRNTDDGVGVAYHEQQAELRTSSAQLNVVEGMGDEIIGLASLRPNEDITAYARRLYAYGRLARSLLYTDLEWTVTDAPNVAKAEIGGWVITKVMAGGFESAYIERDGAFMPLKDAKEIYSLTRQILGSRMLRLYVSLSREGD